MGRTKEDFISDPYRFFNEVGKVHNYLIGEIIRSVRNFELIPNEATIRLEYIKCGKKSCRNCFKQGYYDDEYLDYHGPYYYAYWRNKKNHGKLKKKYIGKIDPTNYYYKEFLNTLKN